MRRLLPYAIGIAACELAGGIAAIATAPAIPGWYATLAKPAWTPPGWLFGPVWTILYVLMGAAAGLVWSRHAGSRDGRRSLVAFAAQLVLNAAWPFLFFGLRSPGAGLVEILVLWGAVVTVAVWWRRLEPAAFLLLVPYVLWVSFAAVLNAAIWRLNP
jgi:benzodiazapine receptor